MTTNTTPEGIDLDPRQGFEKWMSDRGQATLYQGDGVYGAIGVNEQAEAFRAGVEYALARAAQPAPAVSEQADERALFEATWRERYQMPDEIPFVKFVLGQYDAPAVDDAFTGWKLARAALAHGASSAPADRNSVLEEAAQIAENYGAGRPIVARNPGALIQGRWEGEQAASKNIAAAIRAKATTAGVSSALADTPAANSVSLDHARALHAAVSALYFDDSSYFRSALGAVVRHLDRALAGEMLGSPKSAYDQACSRLDADRAPATSTATPASAQPAYDQAFDRNAERLTRNAGLGGGRVNPNATSIDDLFVDDEPASAQPAEHSGTAGAIEDIADELEAEAMNYEGDFAGTVKGCVEALRNLLAQSPASAQPVAAAPADFVLMPTRLTAENGAKGALSGEFKESIRVTCPECDGSGEMDDEIDCGQCDGEGTVEQSVTVGWDTIKDIYKAAVELLAAPAAPVAQAAELSNLDLLRRAATEAADYLEAVAKKTSKSNVWERCSDISGDLRSALAAAVAPPVAADDVGEPPSRRQEKLRALADRIDHEKLWKRPMMYRYRLTDDQRDRLDAAVSLRRYADLLAPGRWLVLPPIGPVQFSASTLDAAYAMAKRDEARKADAAMSAQQGQGGGDAN